MQSTRQGFDELAETKSQEDGPQQGKRAHDIEKLVINQGHVHGVARLSVRLPEQHLGTHGMHETTVSSKVDGQILVGIIVAQGRVVRGSLTFDCLQDADELER